MRTNTQISVAEAAKQTGKNKSTITRRIEGGKISAIKDEAGQYWIEPAELFRVIPPLPLAAPASPQNASNAASRIDATDADNALIADTNSAAPTDAHRRTIDALRGELEALRRINEVKQEERERERRQQEERIEDLVHRLDASESERRQKDAQLTALLTDERQKQPEAPKGWFRRLVSS